MQIPAGPLSPQNARRLSELLRQLQAQTEFKGSGAMGTAKVGASRVITNHTPRRILMQLTGHEPWGEYDSAYPDAPPGYNPDSGDYYEDYSGCRYSWFEVDINPDSCGYAAVEDGERGWVDRFPAVAVDANDSLPDGTIVEAWLAPSGTHWRFVPGGAGGGGDDLVIDNIACVELVITDNLS